MEVVLSRAGQGRYNPQDENPPEAAQATDFCLGCHAGTPFCQAAAFGNNRFNLGRVYNFGLDFIIDNSALDARPYSLTGFHVSLFMLV